MVNWINNAEFLVRAFKRFENLQKKILILNQVVASLHPTPYYPTNTGLERTITAAGEVDDISDCNCIFGSERSLRSANVVGHVGHVGHVGLSVCPHYALQLF